MLISGDAKPTLFNIVKLCDREQGQTWTIENQVKTAIELQVTWCDLRLKGCVCVIGFPNAADVKPDGICCELLGKEHHGRRPTQTPSP